MKSISYVCFCVYQRNRERTLYACFQVNESFESNLFNEPYVHKTIRSWFVLSRQLDLIWQFNQHNSWSNKCIILLKRAKHSINISLPNTTKKLNKKNITCRLILYPTLACQKPRNDVQYKNNWTVLFFN